MDYQIGVVLLTAGLTTFVIAAGLLSWPYRREHQFRFHRLIAAPSERIWATYRIDLDDPRSAKLHSNTVSARTVQDSPEIREYVLDLSGGHGTHLLTARCEILAEHRPTYSALRVCAIGEEHFPFGRENIEAIDLTPRPDGTLTSITWRGETKTLWQLFALWRINRGHLRKLQRMTESDMIEPEPRAGRASLKCLVLSALALGSFALFFGWLGALLLAGILIVHEFGHWLAMRLTGQPAPRMMLIPFLGGVAIANHPHKSLFDDAFCALMGPGFSVLPCLALLLSAYLLGVPDITLGLQGVEPGLSVQDAIALIAALIATLVGGLNLLQLLPVLPLDGGQVLRAVVQSFSVNWSRHILLGVTGFGMAGFSYTGDYVLVAILALGALQAWHLGSEPPKAHPMSASGLTVIGLGYALTLAVHAGAVLYGFQIIGYQIF